MNKYVCDFEQLKKEANNLNNKADEMTKTLNDYISQTLDIVNNWDGPTSSIIKDKLQTQINDMEDNINYIKQCGEFLINCSNKIQRVEEELSKKTI